MSTQPSTEFARYSRLVLGSVAGIALALAAFNILADTRGLFGSWLSEDQLGFDRNYSDRIARAELAHRGDWSGAVFGSSRVHTGIDTRDAVWSGDRVLNMGLPKTNLCELERATEFVRASNDLRFAYFFVSSAFFGEDCSALNDFSGSRFDPNLDLANYYLENAIGLRATQATLEQIGGASAVRTDEWGVMREDRPSEHPLKAIVRILQRNDAALRKRRFAADQLARFTGTIERFLDAGIDVYIVHTPIHATFLETEDLRGQREGPDLLVRTLAEEASRWAELYPERRAEFWDFRGYRADSIVSLPRSGEQWVEYRDPSHFRAPMGARIIATVKRGDAAAADGAAPLGYRLDRDNVEEHLRHKRREQAAYRANQPEDVEQLREILAAADGGPEAERTSRP